MNKHYQAAAYSDLPYTVCVFYPIVIAQIWGMNRLSKLDEKTIEIAEIAMYQYRKTLLSCSRTGSGSYPDNLFHLELFDNINNLAEPFCDIKGSKTAPKNNLTQFSLHFHIWKSSVNQKCILHFHFCLKTGKQEFRHCPVLRNQCRKIRSARLIYLSRYIIQVPSGNLPLFAGQFQHLFREDGNLALVQRVGFHGG